MYLSFFQDLVTKIGSWSPYVDLIASFVVAVLLGVVITKVSKRPFFVVTFVILYLLIIIGQYLELKIFTDVVLVLMFGIICGFFVIHSKEFVGMFAKKKKKRYFETFDGEAKTKFGDIIENAVLTLSATKTGAIITFEKNENLDEYIARGEVVDAPVTSELLRTIFYPGTPLHDGAVIIRGFTIEAASVYYTPTTKPMTGKFGARHRAAIGFSEVHDAVTVVVSEETGRISFAIGGELIPVPRDGFRKRFEEYIEK